MVVSWQSDALVITGILEQGESRVARFFLPQYSKTGKIYQMTIRYTKWPHNIQYGRKIDQMATKCTSSIERPSKIYPNSDFFSLNLHHLAALPTTL
jgi:hypothetical protein